MQLKGVYTALVTPFIRKGVNHDKMTELVEFAVNSNLSGVVPLGSTGETPAMDDSEQSAVITNAVASVAGRVKVIIGAGSNNSDQTVNNVKRAADLGADAVLIAAPYYNKPTPEGLKRHFNTVANSSTLPIILYHIPSRCGVGIPIDLVVELSKHQNVIGIKEAGGDLWRTAEIVRQSNADFSVVSGDDGLTLPILSVGGNGVIAVVSNLAPKMMRSMVDAALSGNYDEALKEHQRLAPLMSVLGIETNPGPIKAAMNMYGKGVGQVRPPLAPVMPKSRNVIRRVVGKVGTYR